MRRPIVAGNWKMHGSRQFIGDYVEALAAAMGTDAAGSRPVLVLFPPVGYLPVLTAEIAGRGLSGRVELGAQDLHAEAAGAFTGEMAGEMIHDLGARWVLVGHSERRQYAAETDAQVAGKVAAALRAGLNPVLCVGETESERDAGEMAAVVIRQLRAVTEKLDSAQLAQLTVAYEPVWAIGTGKTATPEIAQEMHALIRAELRGVAGSLADDLRLLYGGSVKAANAEALFVQADIDGGLVGGASLEADEFLNIAEAF